MTDTPQTFEEWFENYNGPMTYGNCWNAGRASMLALDRHVAERYITREEHNNIIRMNETVHKRDVAERVQSAYERGVSDGAAAGAPEAK
jgi:hypothetical protein